MLYNFFENNFTLIYFIYGLFFFLMGFAIALQLRINRNLTALPLAKSLYLLAAFGISHGMSEWAFIFMPLYTRNASQETLKFFHIFGGLLLGVSFLFLFCFGINLTVRSLRKHSWVRYVLPPAVFIFWLLQFIVTPLLKDTVEVQIFAGETWVRYLLGFPAAVLSSYAFWQQYRVFHSTAGSAVAKSFRRASVLFGLYAVATGLIVPEADFFPAAIINTRTFFAVFQIPVQLVRAFCGMAIAYYMIGVLDIFSLEQRKNLEEARRINLLLGERERIARDLHDGIIQQIYAAGLQLKNACFLLKDDAGSASDRINNVLDSLDKIIKDLRNYILELQPVNFEETDLRLVLTRLIRKLEEGLDFRPELKIKGEVIGLPKETCYHIYHIVQEALSNILKHASATEVIIEVQFQPGEIRLTVTDNGLGFEPGKTDQDKMRAHHGLHNMMARSSLIGAKLDIHTEINNGTRISLII